MDDRNRHTCEIKTARINYAGRDGEVVLNTTVKSGQGTGTVFAPTWQMVMASKRGQITWDDYTQQYTALMRQRYAENQQAFLEVLNHKKPVVSCYCKDTHQTDKHCHRYILIEILEKIAKHHGINFKYAGEAK